MFADPVTGPLRGARSGVGGDLATGVHDRELPAFAAPALRVGIGIARKDLADGVGGRMAFAQERQRLGAVADIDDRLGGDDPHPGLAPDDAIAH